MKLILAVVLAATILSALSVYRFSTERSETRAEAAVVLGAAVWRDRPSPVYRERIEHAVDLYMAGAVDYIIFTGGVGHNDALSEAEVGRQYAIAVGSDPGHMLTESDSEYTHENLVNARDLAIAEGISSYLIVSDPLHMKRALAIADDLGMEAYPSPTPSSRYQSWRTKLPFLLRETYYYLGYQLRKLVQPQPAGNASRSYPREEQPVARLSP